jgi:transcriptional regulator with XRE-family HTH domain
MFNVRVAMAVILVHGEDPEVIDPRVALLQDALLRQLAKMAGISNPYLSQIERGLRAPSERVLEAIARSLELSAETLAEQAGLGGEGEEEDEPEAVRAIEADPNLKARQRQSLIAIYRAFVAENAGRRPRRRK